MIEAAARRTTSTERLRGLAVTLTGQRFCAALFSGDAVVTRVNGRANDHSDVRRFVELLDGTSAIVTDDVESIRGVLERTRATIPPIWDVVELATLLVPTCSRDSLERTADFFGIVADRPIERLLMLFELLVTMLEQVETQTLLHVTRLASGLVDWPLRSLFQQVQSQHELSSLETGALAEGTPIGAWITQGATTRRRKPDSALVTEPRKLQPIGADELSRCLATDADIARELVGYEQRPEQQIMAQFVADALNSGGQLVLEAGTGTGKSLAYLLPTVLDAVRNEKRAVISTATTTLQDQLFEHDLPLVQHGLRTQQPLRATVLKGRNNYLCLRRWQLLLQAGDLTPGDRMLLIKTLFWLPRTATGDRAELQLSPAEEEAWQRLAAVAEACTPLRCAYHRIGVCFLARARRAAEESHVVIANHALLLTDLVSRSKILPSYDTLVIDEAHHLEDEATQQLGWRLGERELLTRLERLWSPSATGAVPEALSMIAAANGLQVPPALRRAIEPGERAAAQLALRIRRLFEHLMRLLEDPELLSAGGDDLTLRITAAVRAGSGWQELEEVWSDSGGLLKELERATVEVTAELEGLPEKSDAARDLAAELSGQLDYWRDVRRRLDGCIHERSAGVVHWISGGGRFRSAFLNAAPIEVATLLRERLFSSPETSVLVSATMSIGGTFDYVTRRLGLEDATARALGSPFDYARAALLYVPHDLPDPTQPGYQQAMERTILDVISRLRGRTLVLFTSRTHLRVTYHALRDRLAAQGIKLMAQGIDETSRTRLLDRFRRGSRVALFGTNAFWEGIDVVGEALSCVMVTRLPFAVPTDPVYAARAEQFDDPFGQYAVPQAVLRLKQGFGRLIRSRTDRGAVIVLDRRLVTRFYGQVFLRSLPPCSVKQGPAGRAGVEVADWVLTPEAEQMALEVAPG